MRGGEDDNHMRCAFLALRQQKALLEESMFSMRNILFVQGETPLATLLFVQISLKSSLTFPVLALVSKIFFLCHVIKLLFERDRQIIPLPDSFPESLIIRSLKRIKICQRCKRS